jgi:cellulose synthase/poly-beta-1,6-N-acetylglucosamine synthase-like glycosyltransferase
MYQFLRYNTYSIILRRGLKMNEFINYIKDYLSNNLFLVVLGILTFYQSVYIVIGFFSKKRKFNETEIYKKYAIVIAARNEEMVIGKLIDSIKQQNYDKDKIDIFVVADNCSDNTAKIAREHGAIVYERFDETKKRKGWALEFLFEQIKRDYGISSFDGYIFFDADNLVHKNFVHEINKAFVEKGGIVTGYRNIKNFDTNLISSAYGIHFYRSVVNYHRPRQRLNLGTHIAGTGYVIDSKLLLDGWNFHGLTEDTELTLYYSSKGEKISFCEDAIFYDEQPTNFFVAFRQRLRWTRGRLDAFIKTFPRLIVSTFKRLSFTTYDLFFYGFPWPFYTLIKFIFYPIIIGIIAKEITTGVFWLDFLKVLLSTFASLYLVNFLHGLLVVIRESKNIPVKTYKKIIAVFTYPWFNMITMFLALGVIIKPNVKWTRIVHDDKRSIEDIEKEN